MSEQAPPPTVQLLITDADPDHPDPVTTGALDPVTTGALDPVTTGALTRAVAQALRDDGYTVQPAATSDKGGPIYDRLPPPPAGTARHQQGRLLDLVHDAVTVRDPGTGTIRYWNPGAAALYGWPADEATGRSLDALLRTRYPRPLPEILAALARAGRWEGHLEQRTRDGHPLTVASRWALRRDERGTAIVQVDRDITAQQRAEAARAALARARDAEVRRLGELAALKADFSAMVAHELLGPLAAIARLADLLAIGDLPPATHAQAVDHIRAEVALLNALATDVRAAATAERDDFAVAPRPVPLAPLLHQAAAHARALPGAGPVTVTDTTPPATRVLADPDRVLQVLRNLLDNAVKYSPPTAPIALRTALDPQGDRARVAVADQGCGIAPDDIPRILEKFGRGRDPQHRRVHGVGLGLYLSRRIVQAHGGDLTVDSAPGAGATFAFTLPVQP